MKKDGRVKTSNLYPIYVAAVTPRTMNMSYYPEYSIDDIIRG